MIQNERQYSTTKTQVEKFAAVIAQLRNDLDASNHIHPRLRQAEIDGMESLLADLLKEIDEYEATRG